MYAFVHIPKTAGTTFRHILRCNFGPRHLDIKSPKRGGKRKSGALVDADDLRRARRVYPKLAGICGHRVTPHSLRDSANELCFFAILREPNARFISHFNHNFRHTDRKPTRDDFLAWCDNPKGQNEQARMIAGTDHIPTALAALQNDLDFIGLTERFDESLLLFQHWLGTPLNLNVNARNITNKRSSLPFLEDPELRVPMEQANAADHALYKQAVETLFPSQLATYPRNLQTDLTALAEARTTTPFPTPSTWTNLKRNLIYKPALSLRML